MCGRFALSAKTSNIEKLVNKNPIKVDLSPRFNITPTQNILTLKSNDPDNCTFTRWGLIPSWAKDSAIGNSLINARAETLSEKPSFRNSFKSKRCLIFSDGYYEWRTVKGSKNKVPYFVHFNDFEIFAFAGLWDSWISPDGIAIESSTIITTSTNKKLAEIHHRMPVIIEKKNFDTWLDVKIKNSEALNQLLNPLPEDRLDYYEVSTLINNPANDVEECMKPVECINF